MIIIAIQRALSLSFTGTISPKPTVDKVVIIKYKLAK